MNSFIFTLLLLTLPFTSVAINDSADLYTIRKENMVTQNIDQVFITQESIGLYYAKVKMAEKTGIALDEILHLDSGHLSQKQLEKIQDYAHKSILEEEFPAILSPKGQLFIVDGHHNLYMAVLAKLNLSKSQVHLKILQDYKGTTEVFFINDLIQKHLVYSKSEKSLLSQPRTIDSVGDNVERSLTGLAFMRISDKYQIPFKGTCFKPFVQFDLADLLRTQNLFEFNEDYSQENIKKVAKAILNNKAPLEFLIGSLTNKAPQKVIDFLADQKKQL